MNWKRKLQNPFVLTAQGFVLGAVIFLAAAPGGDAAPVDAAPQASRALEQAVS